MSMWKVYVMSPMRFEAEKVETINTRQVLIDGKLFTFAHGYRGLMEEPPWEDTKTKSSAP